MSQLSFYNDLFFPCNEATTSTTSENVKVSHRYSITANVLRFIIENDFYRDCDFLEVENSQEELEMLVVKALAEQGTHCSPDMTNEEQEQYDLHFDSVLFEYTQALKAWLTAIEHEREQYVHAPSVEEWLEDIYYHYGVECSFYDMPNLAHYEYVNICRNYVKQTKKYNY